jgi:pimeloyl-ACP methyl ester carboxylesterase
LSTTIRGPDKGIWMKKRRAVVASIAAAAVGLAISGTINGAATAAPTHKASTAKTHAASYTPPALKWHQCADETLQAFGSQCADLIVPLDYSKPNGKKISLAVSRLKHSSPDSKYQGPMLVNPGGPGGSGLIYSVFGEGSFVPGDGDLTYDWIGFDPRGVGDSKPALTCDPKFFGYDRPPYKPTTKAIGQAWLNRSANYAKACKNSQAGKYGLLDHVKTTDSVNDMESLRKALNYPKVSLYGFSYGTYLGQVYASLHPDRVNRFVFDGVVDPRGVWYQANLDQDVAFEKTINVYFRWLADHDNAFHLGTSASKIRQGYFAESAKLDKKAAGGVIGGDELADVMLSAGYYVYDWVEIGDAYSALVNKGDYSGIKAMYDDANPQTPGSDNGNAMYLATSCTDAKWPQSLRKIYNDNVRVDKQAPFFTWGNAWFNGPCSFWPAGGGTPVHIDGHKVKNHILLVAETLDAATPFSGALEVRKRFPTSSLIEGVGGTTHAGTLSGVECTDNAIGRYLTNGSVPSRKSGNQSDLKCPPVPQPEPGTANGLRKSDSPSSSNVRQLLQKELAKAQIH